MTCKAVFPSQSLCVREGDRGGERREKERETETVRTLFFKQQNLLRGRRGSSKKQEEVECGKSMTVIIGNKNNLKYCKAKVPKNKQ